MGACALQLVKFKALDRLSLVGYYCWTLPWLVAARSFGHSMYRLVPPQTGHSITRSIARLDPSFSIGWPGLEPSAGVGHAPVIARGPPSIPSTPVSGPRVHDCILDSSLWSRALPPTLRRYLRYLVPCPNLTWPFFGPGRGNACFADPRPHPLSRLWPSRPWSSSCRPPNQASHLADCKRLQRLGVPPWFHGPRGYGPWVLTLGLSTTICPRLCPKPRASLVGWLAHRLCFVRHDSRLMPRWHSKPSSPSAVAHLVCIWQLAFGICTCTHACTCLQPSARLPPRGPVCYTLPPHPSLLLPPNSSTPTVLLPSSPTQHQQLTLSPSGRLASFLACPTLLADTLIACECLSTPNLTVPCSSSIGPRPWIASQPIICRLDRSHSLAANNYNRISSQHDPGANSTVAPPFSPLSPR